MHTAIGLHILITKHREPGEAAFWLLAVLLIPVFGVVGYLLFGIVRLGHSRRKIMRLQDAIRKNPGAELGARFAALEDAMSSFQPPEALCRKEQNRTLDNLFPDAPITTGNRLEMLCDGVTAYPRMLEDIRNARHCIRMQSFILMSDHSGRAFMNALEAKADEGVDVKVIFDSFGSLKSYFSHYFRIRLWRRKKNFRIRAFSPFNLLAPWRFQLRNHRKLLLVDGRIAYSGGINISEENELLTHVPASRHIHDLHCRLEGPAVVHFTRSFLLDWAYTTRGRWLTGISVHDFPIPSREGDDTVRVLAGGPGSNFEGTKQLFFTAAVSARRSLWIMTPYFVPGAEYIRLLCLAAARGVDVRIVVPANNNHFFVDWAAQNFYLQLLEAGVKLYRKEGVFSHIKALLMDEEWGFMGSSNCDSRSFRLNFELDFCFEGGMFVKTMRSQFQAELAHSEPISLEEERRKPLLRRVLENVCALLTPIL